MTYSIFDFQKEFSNDDVCLDYIFKKRYPDHKGWYRIAGRKAYANVDGEQIYPLKGTIFEKSETSLQKWFCAIFMFSCSKNGVSAKELERTLGLYYKTAWRMAQQIRKLMSEDGDKLSGNVEMDEAQLGSRKHSSQVLGAVQRGGKIKLQVAGDRTENSVTPFIEKNIRKGSRLITDAAPVYKAVLNMKKESINKHKEKRYVRGHVHVNTIEGFFGQFKRSVYGTYHFVSKKHLQKYLDEFAFRYNHRFGLVFEAMMARI